MTEHITGLFPAFLDLLEDRGPLAIVAMGIFGLVIGSFLSVIVIRLPVMQYYQAPENWSNPPEGIEAAGSGTVTLIAPRSRCVQCGHQLRWFENIPIVSYLFLRAKCAVCHAAISPLYPIIELLASIAAIIAVLRFGGDIGLFGALVLSFALIPIAFVDARHFIIPDDIVLPMIWLGLFCNAFEMFAPLKEALFGAIAGYVALWSIYWLHRIATGKEGMGYGDFKLAAMLGAWLGVGLLPIILVLAFAGGAIVGTSLMIARRATIASAIPFGPYLVIAGWVSLYWGDLLVGIYWGLALPW